MNIKDFKAEDAPLIIDATFALALQAYSLALLASAKVLNEKLPADFTIKDVLLSRFLAQGFDLERSDKVSNIIDITLKKLINDAQRELNEP